MKRRLGRYLVALAAVLVAVGLRWLLLPFTGSGAPFGFFFVATLFTGLFAGVGPALLTIVLGCTVAGYTLMDRAIYPISRVSVETALYAFEGLLVVYLCALVRRARRGLEEASRHTREVISLAPEAFFQADLAGRYTDVNEAACKLLGYPRDELLGKTIFDTIPPEDASRLRSTRTELLSPGRVSTGEWTMKRKDGSSVEVEVIANILPDGRWQAFVRDIHERKRLDAQFRKVIALMPDGVFVYQAGRVRYVNAAMTALLGFDDPAELIGQDLMERLPPEERTPIRERVRAVVETHATAPPRETRLRRKDGTYLSVETAGLATEFEGRSGIVVVVRDLTLRKRGEAALRESEERLQLALGAANMGNWDLDIVADKAVTSLRHDRIFGYSGPVAAWGVATFLEHVIPEDRERVKAHLDEALRSDSLDVECRICWPDRSVHWIQAIGRVSRGPEGAPSRMVGVVMDCTGRRALEEALRDAVAEREHVLGIVAHDLRNPLASITLQASMLALQESNDAARNQRVKNSILRSAQRMNRLIQDLLDVSLVDSGKLRIDRRLLPAGELVAEAIDLQKSMVSSAQLELRVAIEGEAPQILADHDRLLQVFENLIGNAIKASRPGGRLTVGAADRGDAALFWVGDTGTGISADDLPHVFERFWRGRDHASSGAGLGLPITKGIVEAHGGRIWAESTPGQGSTFYFSIPKAARDRVHPSDFLH